MFAIQLEIFVIQLKISLFEIRVFLIVLYIFINLIIDTQIELETFLTPIRDIYLH